MKLRRKTIEIFKRCFSTSGWLYNDTVFLSKKYNWEKFKQWSREQETKNERKII